MLQNHKIHTRFSVYYEESGVKYFTTPEITVGYPGMNEILTVFLSNDFYRFLFLKSNIVWKVLTFRFKRQLLSTNGTHDK